LQLSKPQQVISNDKNRFRVAACGRRFGKSFLSINEMAKFARYPNQRVLYIANTYRQAKQVIWQELLDQLYKVNWIEKVNQSDLEIQLINGSRIFVRSAENREALRGTKYNFIVLDECGDINPDTWYTVLRPTLSDTGGHALFIGTPKSRNWFFDLWMQAGAQSDWSSYQYTTLEGGWVPEEEIEAAKRDLDERQYKQEYESQFIDYAGVIFYAFGDHNIKKFEHLEPSRPILLAVDFNLNPISGLICVKTADTLHVIDEVEIYGSNTNELAQEVKDRYGTRQYFAYPDATGKRTSTASSGVSDHLILNNAGFKVIAPKSNPSVLDTISVVNSRLKSSTGEVKLFIDPKCKRLREALIKHVYKEGTRQPEKNGANDYSHMTDCLRYICHNLYPLKNTNIQSRAPGRRQTGFYPR